MLKDPCESRRLTANSHLGAIATVSPISACERSADAADAEVAIEEPEDEDGRDQHEHSEPYDASPVGLELLEEGQDPDVGGEVGIRTSARPALTKRLQHGCRPRAGGFPAKVDVSRQRDIRMAELISRCS